MSQVTTDWWDQQFGIISYKTDRHTLSALFSSKNQKKDKNVTLFMEIFIYIGVVV